MPDPREPLGRLVHDTRLACEADRAAAEGRERFNLSPWGERDDWQRELDMRIGEAIATAERERVRAVLREHYLAWIRHVLEVAGGDKISDEKEADRG